MNGMDGQNKPTEENNMRQNRILNYIGAASLLLAVCACGKENLNTTADGDNGGAATALPEGTFVVDYSVSDGETSRAGEEGSPNTSISSLLYLLYDSEGKLVKEREIPDIDHETTWPLTRENMSWEQREALKDTLNSGSTYTAVFLANVKKDLFGGEQTEELLQNKENLTKAVLYLPQTPFTDNNMYYLWKEKLEYTQPEGASDDSRDNPLSKKIILRRLVSRMDITKAEVTDEMIKEGLKEFYYQGETADANKILKAVETALDKFADEACPKEVSWDTNRGKLKEKLKDTGTDGQTVYSKVFESCLSQLVDKCKDTELYESHVASWNKNIDVSFTYTKQANIYNINSLQAEHRDDISSNPKYSVLEDGSIVTIVFSNSAVSYDDFNQLSAFEVGEEVYYILDTPWKVAMGPNEMVSLSCNPVEKISSTDPGNSMSVDVTVNMESLFGNLDSFTSDGFIYPEGTTVTRQKLLDAMEAVQSQYGSWDALKLTLQLPSLENDKLALKASLTEPTNP